MTNKCHIHRLGLVPYEQAWSLQETLAGEIAEGIRPASLLLLEHPHTYTFGRRGVAENLLWDKTVLAKRGIQVYWVDRGGDVTYHGPGQLVGYPLIPLEFKGKLMKLDSRVNQSAELPQKVDYVGYLRKLESMLILALNRLGVTGFQVEGLTGVWTGSITENEILKTPNDIAKIASIGVKVDVNGIARHGFALNVNPDMSYWEGIIACGLREYREVSMSELIQSAPNMQQVMNEVSNAFGKEFDYKMIEAPLSL